MKNKMIYIVAILVLLLTASFTTLSFSKSYKRIHQHLLEKEKTTCSHNKTDILCTHLPIVSITTNGGQLFLERTDEAGSQSNSIDANFKIFDNSSTNNHLTDTPIKESSAIIKYRGNSSLWFDKKSYKVNFINEDLSENKVELMGMAEHDEWALNGPFLDKTLIRNYMCMNISGEIMEYVPAVRFCELYVDNNYRGVYLAMETVSRSVDRINISQYRASDPFTSYILRADRAHGLPNELDNFSKYSLRMGSNTSLGIIYPSAKLLTPEIKEYIERDFSKFEKSLYSYDYNEQEYGFHNQINVNTFVDYMVINEFFRNTDAGIFSTYFYKDVRGKINIGPAWDFNNSCDNFIEESHDETGFAFPAVSRYFMLTKEKKFIESVIARYQSLRKTVLSEERLLKYIDETVLYLGDAIERNNAVWGYSFDVENLDDFNKLQPNDRNLASYEASITQLKKFIIKRGRWLDDNISILRQYSHKSNVSKFNH